jgi:hypothetical protein
VYERFALGFGRNEQERGIRLTLGTGPALAKPPPVSCARPILAPYESCICVTPSVVSLESAKYCEFPDSTVKSNGVASPKGLGWFSGSEYRGRVL